MAPNFTAVLRAADTVWWIRIALLISNVDGKIAGATSCWPSTRRFVIRRVCDAFGPRGIFWGTDLSRLPCTYRQGVTMFTEEIPWLTAEDKAWIMGRGVSGMVFRYRYCDTPNETLMGTLRLDVLDTGTPCAVAVMLTTINAASPAANDALNVLEQVLGVPVAMIC